MVGKTAEENEARRPQQQRRADDEVRLQQRHFENRLKVEQRVELSGVPDHALAHRRAEQRQRHPPAIERIEKTFLERTARGGLRVLELLEQRRFAQRESDVNRDGNEDDRNQN